MTYEYETTKAERREQRRNKQRRSPKGTPWTKIRTSTDEEVRYREFRRKQLRKQKERDKERIE